MTLQPPAPAPPTAITPAGTTRPYSADSRLAALNAAGMARLQEDGADRTLLLQLLETSCLLELSRLAGARLDLVSHLQLAVDVLTELFPCRGCLIVLQIEGLPAARAAAGDDPGSPCVEEPLMLGGVRVGSICFGPPRVELGPTSFFESAAEQLSKDIATVVEAELLRRRAALAAAEQAAASLTADHAERGLRRLVEALAVWPGAVGAQLEVDHPALGAPVSLRAGWWDPLAGLEGEEVVTVAGVTARVRAAEGESVGSDRNVTVVLEALWQSLERIGRERRLASDAETDPLTGAGNRRRLDRVLPRALLRAEHQGERVAVMAFDLDWFKRVNDMLGHDVGDQVLRSVVATFHHHLRRFDDVVRSGGEEFLVVSPGSDVVAARTMAEALQDAVTEACAPLLPQGWRQTISAGIAVYPDMGRDAAHLLRLADGALYRAKGAGRRMVCVAQAADATRTDSAPRTDSAASDGDGDSEPAGPLGTDGTRRGGGRTPALRPVLGRLARSLRGSRLSSSR